MTETDLNRERHAELLKHTVTMKMKADCRTTTSIESRATNCMDVYSVTSVQADHFDSETGDLFLDELDEITLKERLGSVLKRKSFKLSSKVLESFISDSFQPAIDAPRPRNLCSIGEVNHHQSVKREKERDLGDQNLPAQCDSWMTRGNDGIQTSERKCIKNESDGGEVTVSDKVTPIGSSGLNFGNVKVEAPECIEFQSFNTTTVVEIPFRHTVTVKKEDEISDDLCEDELDHILLRERMKLFSSKDVRKKSIHNKSSKFLGEFVLPASGHDTFTLENMLPVKVNRPWKRRKTITDSVETAMEEDAPGLLQVLIGKGVSVNEIKLYGESENDDCLDDSSNEENFADLEAVIAKLFTKRESLLKLGHLQNVKGEKASYCLECLFSLVEQARYLKFRKWPVEWGWCRDLQSFIFIFERHNRMILERPEYGYATYFFELVTSLSVDWQIRRLVTMMKLTSCGRVSLIENKALMVGDELTEGEARVLMKFGWVPNTGLGTMLNYHDRVVHDRKYEKCSSEWSTKIGKLLVDGYNGGSMMSTGIINQVSEPSIHIKPELLED